MKNLINYLTNASPWELTAITCGVMTAGGFVVAAAYLVVAAIAFPADTEGEGDEGGCAWCNPGTKHEDGVCPEHAAKLAEESRALAKQEGAR